MVWWSSIDMKLSNIGLLNYFLDRGGLLIKQPLFYLFSIDKHFDYNNILL